MTFPELDGGDWDGDGALEVPPESGRSEAARHEVNQGERLATIALLYGFARWQTVWEFRGNDAIRTQRKSPEILLPGDGISIPTRLDRWAEVTGGSASYHIRSAAELLRVRFIEADFGGKQQARFVARPANGAEVRGSLEANGTMQIELIPGTRKVSVNLFLDPAAEPFATYELAIGHLDPSDEISGIQARLANLGYYSGPINGELDETTRRGISEFRMEILGDNLSEVDHIFIEALGRAYHV